MKRRSRAGGKASKARGREASKTKRRDAPKTASSSAPIQDAEVARLTRELNEALEQQAATSEVLEVISGSPGDPEPVFATMLENAVRICDAKFGNIYRWDGEALNLVATHNTPPAYAEFRRRTPFRADQKNPVGHMITTKAVVQVANLAADQTYVEHDPGAEAAFQLGGTRTFLAVPMLKENELIGAFIVSRQEVRPFSDKQIALVTSFAAQAVIAIENARLLDELRQRTSDLTEALDRQTATSEVLSVISSSPGDFEPVFATMLEKAVRICGATFGNVYGFHDDALHLAASHHTPPAFVEYYKRRPIPIDPLFPFGRMVKSKSVVQVADLVTEEEFVRRHPAYVAGVELGGIRTFLAVPMFRNNELVGAFSLARHEVRLFTEKQIELVKNFAAQAVIAIENARLLNELRQSLEQQTATSQVLQVISSSPGDLQHVFATMLENATRICEAKFGALYLSEGDGFRATAMHNAPPAYEEARAGVLHPPPSTSLWRAANAKQAVQIADVRSERGYVERDPFVVSAVALGGYRSVLSVPMLHEDELVGVITIFRQEVRPFTDEQISLVQNFAAQAVIAIENARLLNDLRKSLQQQTATADVLKVISRSTFDLPTVLHTLTKSAVRLCVADKGIILLRDGDVYRWQANYGFSPEALRYASEHPVQPDHGTLTGRVALEGKAVQIRDVLADPEYRATGYQQAFGYRTALAVPLLREEATIGVFFLSRDAVNQFNEKQIELVTTFADQAVIAIENARLLNELRRRTTDLTEALEQQTATSDVLKIISGSPGELQPIFDAMLTNATQLCGATYGTMWLNENEGQMRMAARHGPLPKAFSEKWRIGTLFSPSSSVPTARVFETRQPVQVRDLKEDRSYLDGDPLAVASVDAAGIRSLLAVPMIKDGATVGAITVYRQEVRPFTDKQIELVENFAAQAVIAIENARLLNELRERTDQLQVQSKELADLNQQLEQRVTDQVGEIERMGRLRRFLPPQVADLIVASGTEKQLESHRREITALFCDLRGFTGFSESADPEDVMTVLREYHEALGASIIKYSGTLERYAGDGVMVVFNDPVPVENPALQAVLMALEMRDAIGALTETWHRWGHDIGFGIGIAHGFATLGTIGFEGRFDYAAIGTVSNVASQLCDEAKPGQILISPRVLTKVENAVTVRARRRVPR